jgi:hypothetical protein
LHRHFQLLQAGRPVRPKIIVDPPPLNGASQFSDPGAAFHAKRQHSWPSASALNHGGEIRGTDVSKCVDNALNFIERRASVERALFRHFRDLLFRVFSRQIDHAQFHIAFPADPHPTETGDSGRTGLGEVAYGVITLDGGFHTGRCGSNFLKGRFLCV